MTPALLMNLFSITSHRGCFGACAFCAIHGHQGRRVISRSPESVLNEICSLKSHPGWKGTVSDIGGATAEMFGADCSSADCDRESCLFPAPCRPRPFGQKYLELLRRSRGVPGVKNVFVASGLRHDLLLQAPELLEEIMRFHSGRFLRVAPEHSEDHVLNLMGKSPFAAFADFVRLFNSINRRLKRKIDLALYLVVGHPGERRRDVVAMKKKLRTLRLPQLDVQIFTPTPGTLSTAMYHSGLSPQGESLEVERSVSELEHRRLLLLD